MTDEAPIFESALEQLIHELRWSDETSDLTKTLVVGNIRGAIARLIEEGALVPLDLVLERAADLRRQQVAVVGGPDDA